MSAWLEAFWIVRKIKKFFNLNAKIEKCSNDLNEINTNITEISDSIDQFNQRIEGFENVSELESTINQINNRITANADLLNSQINILNNFTQTPAIFDTDVNADDIHDTRSDEFTNNSLWFIEENNGE